jgi:hypothetical protein
MVTPWRAVHDAPAGGLALGRFSMMRLRGAPPAPVGVPALSANPRVK